MSKYEQTQKFLDRVVHLVAKYDDLRVHFSNSERMVIKWKDGDYMGPSLEVKAIVGAEICVNIKITWASGGGNLFTVDGEMNKLLALRDCGKQIEGMAMVLDYNIT